MAVAGPGRAQVEPPFYDGHQVSRREEAQPLRRQDEGQGQSAQELAEPVDVGPVGGVEGPSAAGLTGVGQEEGAGGGLVQALPAPPGGAARAPPPSTPPPAPGASARWPGCVAGARAGAGR